MEEEDDVEVPDPNKLNVGYRDHQNRKISVSFISEVGPTCNSVDPSQVFGFSVDPSLKFLQQKILRLQVIQVVLGLTLMVLSGVALIEERGLFGLGFGLISALLGIISAAFGIQQCDLKMTSILNISAFIGLLPTFYFTVESLVEYSQFYITHGLNWTHHHNNSPHHHPHHHHNFSLDSHPHHSSHHHAQHPHHLSSGEHAKDNLGATEFVLEDTTTGGGMDPWFHYDNSSITTIWTLSWLELFHLIPLAISILYLLFLYRHLSYYTHY